MKFEWVHQHRHDYPIAWICRALQVSESGYYAWRDRPMSARTKANRQLLKLIIDIHQSSRQTYGYPRIHAELNASGVPCGKHRVARLMKQAGLKTRMKCLWERSKRGKTFEHIETNQLQRDFSAQHTNQRWVSDYTYVPTRAGWLYVAVIMDLFSRKIIGWSMSDKRNKHLTLDALRMALSQRSRKRDLLIHSDQGMEYRTSEYHQLLKDHRMTCSMSRKGNCLDNAAMESFFHTLKTELTHHCQYKTREQAKRSIFEYIEIFYNRQRRHSYLNYLTPVQFERQHASS